VILAALLVLVAWPPLALAEVVTGISDQRGEFFDAPAYRALELGVLRLVVPITM
jgi:hypothetical protein